MSEPPTTRPDQIVLPPFADAFRRWRTEEPTWSIRRKYQMDAYDLMRHLEVPERWSGGLFSSSTRRWLLLDGDITAEEGYGWASHSYILVTGTHLLRLLAHRFGVAQPRRLRGEIGPLPHVTELEAAAIREIHERLTVGGETTRAFRPASRPNTIAQKTPR